MKSFSYHMRRLFAKHAEPHGFKFLNGSYLREIGEQRHAIDYQVRREGGGYTLNLGFDYKFVPSWASFKIEPITKLRLTLFNLRKRLSAIQNWPDQWMPFPDNVEDYKMHLSNSIISAVSIFNQKCHEWNDPEVFLNAYPPPMAICRKRGFDDWSPQITFLASVALHLKKFELATAYANSGLSKWDSPRYQALLKSVILSAQTHGSGD